MDTYHSFRLCSTAVSYQASELLRDEHTHSIVLNMLKMFAIRLMMSTQESCTVRDSDLDFKSLMNEHSGRCRSDHVILPGFIRAEQTLCITFNFISFPGFIYLFHFCPGQVQKH